MFSTLFHTRSSALAMWALLSMHALAGSYRIVQITFDSADHRSHMAYFVYDARNRVVCPSTHPFVVPAFTLSAWFMTDYTLDRSGNTDPNLQTWYFASDRMPGMANKTSGATFHSDWRIARVSGRKS